MIFQNVDKLPDDAKALIEFAFRESWIGWTLAYMIEVRLDDPVGHTLRGGDGYSAHGGNGSPHYAQHKGDDKWAIIHCEAPEWLAIRDSVRNDARVKELMNSAPATSQR